jgi:F0F1-type ATP synthase membrane subunit a
MIPLLALQQHHKQNHLTTATSCTALTLILALAVLTYYGTVAIKCYLDHATRDTGSETCARTQQ